MKIQRILLCLLLLSGICQALPASSAAADFHVDDDNLTGFEDGSIQHPYSTLQKAVAAAAENAGDRILAAAGSYTGTVTIENKTVHLYGGYPGGTVTDYTSGKGGVFAGQDIQTYDTHIQGDGTSTVVSLVDAGSSTLDGCRITGGAGLTDPWKSKGGGVYVYGGSPIISRNTIENNDARRPESPDLTTFGGGIYCEDSDACITGNLIRNNSADGGGGIAIDGGNVVITGNTIQKNKAFDFAHGGGLLVNSPDASITNNHFIQNEVGRDLGYGWGGGAVIYGGECQAVLSNNRYTGNYAGTAGGGLFIDDASRAVIDHELIYNNESRRNGSGIYIDGAWDNLGSTAVLSNCTVADNVCTDCPLPGHGMAVEYYSVVTVKDSVFWGNGGDDFYADDTSSLTVTSTLSEETSQGQGNLSKDPLFADSAAGDYHLKSTAGRWQSTDAAGHEWITDSSHSPAIDAGDTGSDYSREPVPNGGRVNMGAYGNTAEASKSSSGSTDHGTMGFYGFSMIGNPQANVPVTISVNVREENASTIYYRFSTHPDYGTSGYDGLHWKGMTSSEYQTQNNCNYTFDSPGKSIVVVWATASGSENVDPTGIPIIGWSVDSGTSGCPTNFTDVTVSGEPNVDEKLTFTVNAVNSCNSLNYYRFSMHPDYGTSGYDGTGWQSMTDTEWVTTRQIDYTFTRAGKYIVVVWVAGNMENVDSEGIPMVGWSVDIE